MNQTIYQPVKIYYLHDTFYHYNPFKKQIINLIFNINIKKQLDNYKNRFTFTIVDRIIMCIIYGTLFTDTIAFIKAKHYDSFIDKASSVRSFGENFLRQTFDNTIFRYVFT